ncbi:MAG: DUF4760 domain-containing protein [Candidatus Eremiobacteraeota bacterium]|nr:DUF4760 domain-containing protein [Candidatus Eremiobacteraeota bacterium]
MSPEFISSVASIGIALLALVCTTFLLARQVRQMEHERNALAILEAIKRLTDPRVVEIFDRLQSVNERYPKDQDIRAGFENSQDARDFMIVGQFVETIACLSRRRVLDASLLVDAVGLALRQRWANISEFVQRRRKLENNEYILENFEWLARYSAWWKDTPRNKRDKNYDPARFKDVEF